MPKSNNQPDFDHLLAVRPHGRLVRQLDREARAERKSTRAGVSPNPLETFAGIRSLVQQMLDEHTHEYYMHFTMLSMHNHVFTDAAPGTTYVTFDSGSGLPGVHTNFDVDFRLFTADYARVISSGIGDEGGNGKGIRITDDTDFNTLCEVEWNGSSFQTAVPGLWSPLAPTLWNEKKELLIRVKGSSATEDISIRRVDVQIRGHTLAANSDIPPD